MVCMREQRNLAAGDVRWPESLTRESPVAAVHIRSHEQPTALKHHVCSFIESGGLRPDPVIGIGSPHAEWQLIGVEPLETPVAAVQRLLQEHRHAPRTPAPTMVGVMGWATALEPHGNESPAFTACLAAPGHQLSVVILPGKVIWTPEPAGLLAQTLAAWFPPDV